MCEIQIRIEIELHTYNIKLSVWFTLENFMQIIRS